MKVETPELAITVLVPEIVAEPAFNKITAVIAEPVVTVFPPESLMRIIGWVESARPFTAPVGCWVINNLVAAPVVSANGLEIAAVSEPALKVKTKEPAVPVIDKSVKVERPEPAVIVVVPASEPVPVVIVAVIAEPEVVTVLPEASLIATIGWVESARPFTAPVGCWEIVKTPRSETDPASRSSNTSESNTPRRKLGAAS